MNNLDNHPLMEKEWQAWRQVCELLEARGIVVNEDNELIRNIELWGEELATLRVNQSPEIRLRALLERRQQAKEIND